MPEFFASCACKGKRPRALARKGVVSRPDLVSKLLCERDVARFVVAPDGFGKSLLCAEYAQTLFSFEHVFWVNAKSPCFLRDLDAGTIPVLVAEADPDASLVVFDDLPRLSPERCDVFSAAIDELLARGCEVLVDCAPSNDAFAERHRDRVKLAAGDLLLSDVEAIDAAGDGEGAPASVPMPSRCACLRWGGDDGSALAGGMVAEEAPTSVLLAAFLLMALHEGSLGDVRSFMPPAVADEALGFIEENYPFLGVDMREGSFSAAPIDAKALASAFSRQGPRIAENSNLADAQALSRKLASMLLARGQAKRACAIIQRTSSKAECAAWLAKHGQDLLEACALSAGHDLFSFVGRQAHGPRARLLADEAFRLALLSDEAAAACARKACLLHHRGKHALPSAQLALALLGGNEERGQAEQQLRDTVAEGASAQGLSAVDAREAAQQAQWSLGVLAASKARVPPAAAAAFMSLRALDAPSSALCYAAFRVFELFSVEPDTGFDAGEACEQADRDMLACAKWSFEYLSACQRDAVPLSAARLALAYAKAQESAQGEACAELPPELMAAAQAQLLALERQRFAHRSLAESAGAQGTSSRNRRSSRRRAAASDAKRVEPMFVAIFGGLEVRIGDERIDLSSLGRKKVKTLLALLVLNRGREVSRIRLACLLWPESDEKTALRNFYPVWSQLKVALSRNGECPYLFCGNGGVGLDARYFSSDLEQFESICRALLFGRVDLEQWEGMLGLIANAFSDELLPFERSCSLVVRKRDECRLSLGDSLLSASSRLLSEGEPRAALWFAREALSRDRGREDAYMSLMQAQVACGQRAAAIDTYFSCRRYLACELGIDPSLAIVGLYNQIIDAV